MKYLIYRENTATHKREYAASKAGYVWSSQQHAQQLPKEAAEHRAAYYQIVAQHPLDGKEYSYGITEA